MRRGLKTEDPSDEIRRDPLTSFPVISVGHVVTAEEVKRFLEEDE
jgi:hypothetical protein